MSRSAIADNYADALFELAAKSGRLEAYGRLIAEVGGAVAASHPVQAVLMNPKVTKAAKAEVLARSVEAIGAPREFGLYLAAVVKRGRQGMLPAIATSYGDRLDQHLGRVRAVVTVARQPGEALEQAMVDTLSKHLGKDVLLSIAIDPAILGGAVVRLGDRVHDGSLRRRLVGLRRQLLNR